MVCNQLQLTCDRQAPLQIHVRHRLHSAVCCWCGWCRARHNQQHAKQCPCVASATAGAIKACTALTLVDGVCRLHYGAASRAAVDAAQVDGGQQPRSQRGSKRPARAHRGQLVWVTNQQQRGAGAAAGAVAAAVAGQHAAAHLTHWMMYCLRQTSVTGQMSARNHAYRAAVQSDVQARCSQAYHGSKTRLCVCRRLSNCSVTVQAEGYACCCGKDYQIGAACFSTSACTANSKHKQLAAPNSVQSNFGHTPVKQLTQLR